MSDHGNNSQGNHEEPDESSIEILNGLITRCTTLLSELDALSARLRELRQEGGVEVAHFRGTVRSELAMLQRLVAKPQNPTTTHVTRSSNLPFLETVWSTAKKSPCLTALQKRVYLDGGCKSLSQGMHHVDTGREVLGKKGSKTNAVVIDAMVDGGRLWAKVSLITNTRLLFDLAKQGWDSGASGGESDDSNLPAKVQTEEDDVPLLKTAKELTRASTLFRVRTKQPKVHIILPRLRPGETPEIDKVLADCRATGAIVTCGEDHTSASTLEHALATMAPNPTESFTPTLNIDCTVLLALVSEFSHAKVDKQPWFHTGLQRQVDVEDNENLLHALLYPALRDRKLVCTVEAAQRMREIVDTIGIPLEKARTALLLGDDKAKTQPELVEEMRRISAHPVPDDWQLPVAVVDQNEGDCQAHLPREAKAVSDQLTDFNKSVFFYGWASGRTTITSNRNVVKRIENCLEMMPEVDDAAWPKFWLCPTARSLVGKEKRGAKKTKDRQGEHDLSNGINGLRHDDAARND